MPINNRFNLPETLAIRIKSLRTRKGLNQSELARHVGVTPTAVWNWENGNTEPRHLALMRIAEVLGVSTAFLETGLEEVEETGHEAKAILVRPEKSFDFTDTIERARRDLALQLHLPINRVKVSVEFY